MNTDPGQTSVVLELPTNRNATLVASDTMNGTTIEKLNVTTARFNAFDLATRPAAV